MITTNEKMIELVKFYNKALDDEYFHTMIAWGNQLVAYDEDECFYLSINELVSQIEYLIRYEIIDLVCIEADEEELELAKSWLDSMSELIKLVKSLEEE